jgi:hypothetical protein
MSSAEAQAASTRSGIGIERASFVSTLSASSIGPEGCPCCLRPPDDGVPQRLPDLILDVAVGPDVLGRAVERLLEAATERALDARVVRPSRPARAQQGFAADAGLGRSERIANAPSRRAALSREQARR